MSQERRVTDLITGDTTPQEFQGLLDEILENRPELEGVLGTDPRGKLERAFLYPAVFVPSPAIFHKKHFAAICCKNEQSGQPLPDEEVEALLELCTNQKVLQNEGNDKYSISSDTKMALETLLRKYE